MHKVYFHCGKLPDWWLSAFFRYRKKRSVRMRIMDFAFSYMNAEIENITSNTQSIK